MQLSDTGIKYSARERQVFALLPRGSLRPRSSTSIVDAFYGRGRAPFHGRKIVIGVLASLIKKTRLNREPFRIKTTGRSGPIPMGFWVEPVASGAAKRLAPVERPSLG